MNVLNRLHILVLLCHHVAANTEIITFSAIPALSADLPWDVLGNGSTLRPTDNERRWFAPFCDGDDNDGNDEARWLVLDLDDPRWASYNTFTLRLSWPASTPAEVEITLWTPHDALCKRTAAGPFPSAPAPALAPALGSESGVMTRVRYARVCAVRAGLPAVPPTADDDDDRLPCVVILEPVYAGVLPATLLPTMAFLVMVVLAAATLVLPRVTAYLDLWVRQAREDVHAWGVKTS